MAEVEAAGTGPAPSPGPALKPERLPRPVEGLLAALRGLAAPAGAGARPAPEPEVEVPPVAQLREELAGRLPKRAVPPVGQALRAAAAALLPRVLAADDAAPGAAEVPARLLAWCAEVLAVVAQEAAGGPRAVAPALLPAAQAVQSALLPASARGGRAMAALAEAAAGVCELWWQRGLEGKERLVAHLPFLFARAVTAGRPVDVKRLFEARHCLRQLDWEDASVEDLKKLLLRCAFHPAFLRGTEGRRFLAHAFGLHPDLVGELAAIVRNQVPAGRQSVLKAYGEVLHRAWKEAEGGCLDRLEHDVLPGLVTAALHARSLPLAESLRRVLDGFHDQKRQPGVDNLLLALYGPTVFRALSAANPAVRINAVHVLVDAFPIAKEEPPLGASEAVKEDAAREMEELLERQLGAFSTAMYDECPSVRAVACRGIGQVLSTFWEIVPAKSAVAWLKGLAIDLAHDATSPSVREAAVDALQLVVDHPLASASLQPLLPKLRPLIFDRNAKVRLALCNLLLAVRYVRQIPFYEIVPVDDLFKAMVEDDKAVASKVGKLLVPSYIDLERGAIANASQLVALCMYKPEVGPRLCRHALNSGADCVAVEEIVEVLCKNMLVFVQESLNRERAKRKRDTTRTEIEGYLDDLVEVPETDEEAVYEGLAQCLLNLCLALEDHDRKVECALKGINIKNSKVLQMLYEGAQTRPAKEAVLKLCSLFPAADCKAIAEDCCAALQGLDMDEARGDDVQALSCAFAWGRAGRILDDVLAALEGAAAGAPPGANKRQRTEGDGPGRQMDLLGALQHLNHFLTTAAIREQLLDRADAGRVASALKAAFEGQMEGLAGAAGTSEEAVLLATGCLVVFAKFSFHAAAGGDDAAALTALQCAFAAGGRLLDAAGPSGAGIADKCSDLFASLFALTGDALRLELAERSAVAELVCSAFDKLPEALPSDLKAHKVWLTRSLGLAGGEVS